MYVGIYIQIVFKVNFAKNEKIKFLCDHVFLGISNIWQLSTNWFKPVQTEIFDWLISLL